MRKVIIKYFCKDIKKFQEVHAELKSRAFTNIPDSL